MVHESFCVLKQRSHPPMQIKICLYVALHVIYPLWPRSGQFVHCLQDLPNVDSHVKPNRSPSRSHVHER
ncbi:hypothetical protein DM860_015870 [Cuscuta australis]|uniref:Uncharacterized protein n=1 Tax=Cuscuta australis TaxID=267555 RepID=A0A328E2Q2_9ASTE|nr:hypothetical protein DM860_015870 [Cuscuta australis]